MDILTNYPSFGRWAKARRVQPFYAKANARIHAEARKDMGDATVTQLPSGEWEIRTVGGRIASLKGHQDKVEVLARSTYARDLVEHYAYTFMVPHDQRTGDESIEYLGHVNIADPAFEGALNLQYEGPPIHGFELKAANLEVVSIGSILRVEAAHLRGDTWVILDPNRRREWIRIVEDAIGIPTGQLDDLGMVHTPGFARCWAAMSRVADHLTQMKRSL